MRRTRLRAPALIALLVLLTPLAACSTGSTASGHATTETAEPPATRAVPADSETQPTTHSGDSADDPAIWVDRKHPSRSLVIGNDKQGALETYDLDGHLVQRLTDSKTFWGNVDVKQDVPLASGSTDVVAVTHGGLQLLAVDRTTRRLSPLTSGGVPLATGGGEGLCLYLDPQGALSVFLVFIDGHVKQFMLPDDGTGHPSLDLVREFDVGSESEGCVVDDATGSLYLAQEDVGLWRYGADPATGDTRTMVDEVLPTGHQTGDIEGVTLVDDGNGKGLVIASSQAPAGVTSYFAVFDRATNHYRSAFRIVDGTGADGCSHTDGIAATAQPLGPRFPHGLFVCQDNDNTAPGSAGNQDFKLTRLETIRP